MRWIYLSPHLDDAILSCGGLIAQQRKAGMDVEIWNWVTNVPDDDIPLSALAERVHAGWAFDSAKEAFTARLEEDRQAAALVGARTRGFNYLDCIYRQADDGSFLYPDEIFVPVRGEDAPLVGEIAKLITHNVRENDILLCPLSIGKHPDHVLVRRAAEQTGHPLRYYADIPYTIWHAEQYTALTDALSADIFPVSQDELDVWMDAIMAYSSQISSLFLTEENMRASLREYWGRVQGINLFTGKQL